MATIIIVLAIVLILGSMFWVLPSPKERRQMLLRKAAMDKGLNVQITKIKDIASPGHLLDCVAYRLFDLDQQQHKEKMPWKLLRTKEDWRMDIDGWTLDKSIAKESIQDIETITGTVARLPEDCIAVESNKQSTSVYWQERGDEQAINDIFDVLTKLQSL